MWIEQTLHGYDEGHRLLASSTSLNLDEERALDMLSDLSGYLPAGTDFESYVTGYPCGRFYVFARTWLDREGRRSGTVFTHSLLLPRGEVAELSTVAALDLLFMKPLHPVARDAYRQGFSWSPIPPLEPWLPTTARGLLAALWFGQEARPLLWTDSDSGTAIATILWMWLPPWLRANHTFCTFALQPRFLGTKLFDFVVVAPGAEGLFYSIRDRAVRCDGRTAPTGAGPILELPWVSEIASAPADAVQARWSEVKTYGLPLLAPNQLRGFLRYRELRGRAESSFTAALSCIDLLRRLAPDRDTALEEKRRSLWSCLAHVRSENPRNRNLLHALEILERDPRTLAPSLSADIGAYLAETLEARAAVQPELGLRLWQVSLRSGFKGPARDGLLEALRGAGAMLSADAWLATVGTLAASLLDDDPAILTTILPAAPLDARKRLVSAWLVQVRDDTRQLAIEAVLDAAQELGDVSLVAPVHAYVPIGKLLDAIDRILSRAGTEKLDSLSQLLMGVPAESLATWLLARSPEPGLPIGFASVIAGALADSSAADTFFERAYQSAEVATILVAYSERFGSECAMRVMRSQAGLLGPLLRLAQDDPFRVGIGELLLEATTKAEPAELVAIFDPVFVSHWDRAPWAQAVAQSVILAVLGEYLLARVDFATLRTWFASSVCQSWFRGGLPSSVEALLVGARGAAAVRAIDVLLDPSTARLRSSGHLVRGCLRAWAEQSSAEMIPLVPAWVLLVKSLTDSELRTMACGLSLQVALNRQKVEFAPLAEIGFATAHQQLMANASFGHIVIRIFMPFIDDSDWDRAGQMREALARVWVENDWPPLSLLRAADGDSELFGKLASRARECPGGKKALRRLWKAALTDPSREPWWDRMLEELPRSAREE
jgi:hypothetical protein